MNHYKKWEKSHETWQYRDENVVKLVYKIKKHVQKQTYGVKNYPKLLQKQPMVIQKQV